MAQEGIAGFQSVTFSFRAQTNFRSESVKTHTTSLIVEKSKEFAGKVAAAARTEAAKYDARAETKARTSANELNLNIDTERQSLLINKYTEDLKEAANLIATIAQQAANKILGPIETGQTDPKNSVEDPQEETKPDILGNMGERLERLRTGDTSSVNESFTLEIISKLNQHSNLIAEKIEQELRGLLPPFVTVKAEVSFLNGSLIMVGTVMLLDWAGTMALKAAKDALEEQFGNAVKIIVKRVFAQVMDIVNLSQYVGPLENLSLIVHPSAQPEVVAQVPDSDVQPTLPVAPQENLIAAINRNLIAQILLWIILITVLANLINSLFTITIK